ncbi:MAG: tungstate ABC transporter substrate-binding protein WtpA [Candidatus Bathyarchaeia archaeon]
MSINRTLIIFGVIAIIAILGGYFLLDMVQPEEKVMLKVFHAGSLTVPFGRIEERFEEDHTGVDVLLEPAGSVQCVRKVTELGKVADVVTSADYSLIPNMMMPDYAEWYILFARNEMTIAYTSSSKYSDEIDADNWYEILNRSDVKWGFSNPNLDPCGYRTLMVVQLSELVYGEGAIFENLVQDHCAITVSESDGEYIIKSNIEDLNPNTYKITIRDKEVELVSLLQAGGIDYAFEYSSVAKQHNLKYLDLPTAIDLSDIGYTETYNRVIVEKTSGNSIGKPIVYGVTIPDNAENPDLAEEFVLYLLNEDGRQTFEELGQPPITPGIMSDLDLVPESLKPYLSEGS